MRLSKKSISPHFWSPMSFSRVVKKGPKKAKMGSDFKSGLVQTFAGANEMNLPLTVRVKILHVKLWPKFRLAIGKNLASHVWCSLVISCYSRDVCWHCGSLCLIGRELVCDISSQTGTIFSVSPLKHFKIF